MQKRSARVLGYQTAYREAGTDGRPVLLIHGGDPGVGPAGLLWSENLDAIAAAGFHVFAPDRPGYGWSDGLDGPAAHDIDLFVDHLEEFVDICIGRPVYAVAGQSRGALLAALLLRRRPRDIERLVITNSNSIAPAYGATIGDLPQRKNTGDAVETIRRLVYDPGRLSPQWLDEVARIAARDAVTATRADHAEARDAYLDKLGRRKVEAMTWLGTSAADRPTLLVWGVGDYMTTLDDGATVFEMVDHAASPVAMSVVNRCGHFPFLEYPARFNALVTDFLNAR